MDYDGVAYNMGMWLILFCATMIYVVMDLCLQGVLHYLFDHWFSPWWLSLFQEYDYSQYSGAVNQTRTENKRKDDGVVYGGNGVYTAQRFNDVWVMSYVDIKNPERGFITEKKPYFNGAVTGYEWRWLLDKGVYGWRQKEAPPPPPEPTVIVSEGIKDQVEEFLKSYRANEINKRLAKLPQKEAKTPDPAEKALIQQQNPQT